MSDKKSFTIKEDWLYKMKEQAFEQGKEESVLAFRFHPDSLLDWYVLDERQFLEYLRYKEEQNDNID